MRQNLAGDLLKIYFLGNCPVEMNRILIDDIGTKIFFSHFYEKAIFPFELAFQLTLHIEDPTWKQLGSPKENDLFKAPN